MNKFEQVLYDYRKRRRQYTINYFLEREGIYGRMDRTEDQLLHRAIMETELIRMDNSYFKRYTKNERRSRIFSSFKPEELRSPITLKSWVEALANLSEKKVESLYAKFMRRLSGFYSRSMRCGKLRLWMPK